jgi:diguanylate cyclase (GGDEF)-like protein
LADESETATISLDMLTAALAQTKHRSACFIVIAGREAGKMFTLEGPSAVIGRTPDAAICVPDVGVSRQHAGIARLPNGSVELRDLGSRNGTFCNGEPVQRVILQDGDKVQVGGTTILKFSYQDAIEQSFQQRQYESVTRDALTGCHNRRHFDAQLPSELAFGARHDRPMSLVMLDLDHFKPINDTHGHPAGDLVLRELGALLLETTRGEDVVCRYGGEEFAVILREQGGPQSFLVAERLRRAIETHRFVYGTTVIPVTASLGVATWSGKHAPDAAALVRAADGALYQAKAKGRNRTEHVTL